MSITLTSRSAGPAQNAPQPSSSEQPVIFTLDTANNHASDTAFVTSVKAQFGRSLPLSKTELDTILRRELPDVKAEVRGLQCVAWEDAMKRADMHLLTKISIKIFEKEAAVQKK